VPKRRPYRTDLTDQQWELIEPILTKWRADRAATALGISEPKHDLREIVNAILYVNRTGVQWDLLPHDFPPHTSVLYYYGLWRDDGTDKRINDRLRRKVGTRAGRASEPTAAVMDSQSVNSSFTADADTVGVDGGKKIQGRKRNYLFDTLGLLLAVIVTAANVHDRHPGTELIDYARQNHPTISKMWADGTYGGLREHAASQGIDLTITTKGLGVGGFTPIPQRWKAERSIGWTSRSRRLVLDYETNPRSAESQVHWMMNGILLRRLTGTSPITTYRIGTDDRITVPT